MTSETFSYVNISSVLLTPILRCPTDNASLWMLNPGDISSSPTFLFVFLALHFLLQQKFYKTSDLSSFAPKIGVQLFGLHPRIHFFNPFAVASTDLSICWWCFTHWAKLSFTADCGSPSFCFISIRIPCNISSSEQTTSSSDANRVIIANTKQAYRMLPRA